MRVLKHGSLQVWHHIVIILAVMLLHSSLATAGLAYKDVRTIGRGSSLVEAINSAISEAVGRVNGKAIETTTELQKVAMSVSTKDDEKYFAGDSYKKRIATATKGVVSSYDVIKQERKGDAAWEVTLLVRVATYKRTKASQRKRIAVMPLRVAEKEFVIDNQPIDKMSIRSQIENDIVAYLVQSRKFTVLDRDYMREITNEKQIITEGKTPVEEMARLGQELVADYILVGNLEDIGFGTVKVMMKTSSAEFEKTSGVAEFSYRIIDVATRQVAFADHVSLRASATDLKEIRIMGAEKKPAALLAKIIANKVGQKVLDAIYPILLINANERGVFLGQGGTSMKIGDQFDVFQYGERMVDPYTKEFLGREEAYVGTIEIVRVRPKYAQAKIIISDIDIIKEFKPKKFVCRVHEVAKQERHRSITERKVRLREIKKNRDEAW